MCFANLVFVFVFVFALNDSCRSRYHVMSSIKIYSRLLEVPSVFPSVFLSIFPPVCLFQPSNGKQILQTQIGGFIWLQILGAEINQAFHFLDADYLLAATLGSWVRQYIYCWEKKLLKWQGMLKNSQGRQRSRLRGADTFPCLLVFGITIVSSYKLERTMRPVSSIVEHDPNEKGFSHWIKLEV